MRCARDLFLKCQQFGYMRFYFKDKLGIILLNWDTSVSVSESRLPVPVLKVMWTEDSEDILKWPEEGQCCSLDWSDTQVDLILSKLEEHNKKFFPESLSSIGSKKLSFLFV